MECRVVSLDEFYKYHYHSKPEHNQSEGKQKQTVRKVEDFQIVNVHSL